MDEAMARAGVLATRATDVPGKTRRRVWKQKNIYGRPREGRARPGFPVGPGKVPFLGAFQIHKHKTTTKKEEKKGGVEAR